MPQPVSLAAPRARLILHQLALLQALIFTDVDKVESKIESLQDEAAKLNARAIIKVYKYSSIALALIAFYYSFVVAISLFFGSFAWIETFALLAVTFLTLIPLLDFIANALKRGMDEEDKRRIDASMYVVKGMVALRSCLILCQGTMLRTLYSHYESEKMTWDSCAQQPLELSTPDCVPL